MGRIKSLASDTLVYGSSTVVGRFLTFLLTPVYTNYLTKVEVGDITYIFSLIAFCNILYSIGMDSAFFRFFSKDDDKQTKNVFTNSYLSIAFISFTFSLIIFIITPTIASSLSDLDNNITLIRLAAFLPFVDSLLVIPYAYLRMINKPRKFALIRFSTILIAVTLNIIFVIFLKWGAAGVFLAQLISSVFGVFFLFREFLSNFILNFDFKLFKQMLRFGLPTLPATLSGMIMQVADRPILKMMMGSKSIALYAVNYRLGIPMMLFVSVFEYAWKPFYLSRYEDEDAKKLFSRVLTYFSLASAIIFLGVGFFIEYIVRMPFVGGRFINPEYWTGMGIIPIVMAAYFFNGVFNNFAAGFQIMKKTEYLPIAVATAAITNVVLNFITIPLFGYWGSAYSLLVSYMISAVILYKLQRKIYDITYDWKRILSIFISCLVIYLLFYFISAQQGLILKFFIRIVGIGLFIILLYYFKFFSKVEMNSIKNLFRKTKNYIE